MLIPYNEILTRYKFKPKGIFHLGAHNAEEAEEYYESGVKNVLWFEGNPELIVRLQNTLKKYPENKVYNIIISDVDGQDVNLNITNETMSSSILNLAEHLQQYPHINVVKTIALKSKRLDTFITENQIVIDDYDFLNIDLQGAELLAIKGLGDYIKKFKCIYTEVNLANLYDGCALLEDLDLHLGQKGFKRLETSINESLWGDALYMQTSISDKELKNSIKEAKDLRKRLTRVYNSKKNKFKLRNRLRQIPFLRSIYFFFKPRK